MKRLDPARLAANAQVDADCGFVRTKAHAEGGLSLIREFVRRDGDGQFLQTDDWFNGATTCPDHEPGPDTYAVVDGSAIHVLKGDDYQVTATVTHHVAGDVDSFGFCPAPRALVDTLTAVNTPWGWRIRSPALLQRVTVAAASRRGDMHPKVPSDTAPEASRCP